MYIYRIGILYTVVFYITAYLVRVFITDGVECVLYETYIRTCVNYSSMYRVKMTSTAIDIEDHLRWTQY